MGYYASTCPACQSPCLFFSAGMYYDCSWCRSIAIMAKAIQLRSSARTQPWGRQ